MPKPPPPDLIDVDAEADNDVIVEKSRNDVSIFSGNILTIDQATDVLRGGETHVLAIIGPNDSGKTTFSLSLYGAFQIGPFDRWNFAGSLTIRAFEERSHLARLEHTSNG